MDRRTFVGDVAGWLLVAPLAARAQQVAKVYRIGILETIPAARNAANLDALRKGLRELGYVEGRNLVIEYRSADGRAERFPDLASELVRLKVDVLVTHGAAGSLAAKRATSTTPIVVTAGGYRQLIVWTADTITSLDPPTGKVFWQVPFRATFGVTVRSVVVNVV